MPRVRLINSLQGDQRKVDNEQMSFRNRQVVWLDALRSEGRHCFAQSLKVVVVVGSSR